MPEEPVAQVVQPEVRVWMIRGSFRPASDAVSRSMVELALELQRKGLVVRIICWSELNRIDQQHLLHPGTVIPLTHTRAGNSYTSWSRVWFLVSTMMFLLRNYRWPDAVVTLEEPTGVGLCVVPLKLLRRKVRHYVYLMDLQSVQYMLLSHGGVQARVVNRFRARLDEWSWRGAESVVVLGDCMQNVVRRISPTSRTAVIPIWQDGRRIHAVDASAARNRAGLSGKTVVMYHGHATFRQPMTDILRAARELQGDDRFQFIVLGTGPSIEWLNSEVIRDSVHNISVNDLASKEEFLTVLSLADVHLAVLDRRATGTCVPSKTYTAMAVGRPCIFVGDSAGQAARDLLEARGGYVVEGGNEGQLADTLRTLADGEVRDKMGKDALRFFIRERDLRPVSSTWQGLLAAGRQLPQA